MEYGYRRDTLGLIGLSMDCITVVKNASFHKKYTIRINSPIFDFFQKHPLFQLFMYLTITMNLFLHEQNVPLAITIESA